MATKLPYKNLSNQILNLTIMTYNEAFLFIQEQKPQLVYLSGKTATGKTTLSAKLHEELGYHVIEMDRLIIESVIQPHGLTEGHTAFMAAHRGIGPAEYTDDFIKASRKAIAENLLQGPVVVDGSIHDVTILQAIFKDYDFTLFHLHPIDEQLHTERVIKRILYENTHTTAGRLPSFFWDMIQTEDRTHLEKTGELNEGFKTSLHEYVVGVMEESAERLENFQKIYPDMKIVEV